MIIRTLFQFLRLKKKGGGQQQVNNPLLVVTRRQDLLFGLFISSATRGISYANLGRRTVQPLLCHDWLHAPRHRLDPSLQLRFFPETLSLFHKAGERTCFVQQFFLSPCAPFFYPQCLKEKKPHHQKAVHSYCSPLETQNVVISIENKTYDPIHSRLHQGAWVFNPPFPQALVSQQPCQLVPRGPANNGFQRKRQNFLDRSAEKAPPQRGHGRPGSFPNAATSVTFNYGKNN